MLASRRSAINFIEDRAGSLSPKCGFQRVPWNCFTALSADNTCEDCRETIKNEYETAVELGIPASNTPPPGFPFKNLSEFVQLPNQAQINPYGYVLDLVESIGPNCRVYENTQVVKIEDGKPCIAYTENAKITAHKIIMATHTPKGIYLAHTGMTVHREFVVAAKVHGHVAENGIYWHLTDSGKYSVRPFSNSAGDFIIATGSPYLTGEQANVGRSLNHVENYLKNHFSVQDITHRWAAQNYKPADGLPYIGTAPTQKHIFIVSGFEADGLVYGTLAAILISDEILEAEGEWNDLYKPTRFTPLVSAKQFVKENAIVVSHLVKDYLFYGRADEVREILPGEGKTVSIDGEKLAAYRDESGRLHLVSAVCTHLGCIVHFNPVEKSWDCPCHGSRFTTRGDVIEGPALKNLSQPKSRDDN